MQKECGGRRVQMQQELIQIGVFSRLSPRLTVDCDAQKIEFMSGIDKRQTR
jgi:hypothetical protein